MIEFAKITGKLSGNRLQVKMRTGETMYAPMIVVGVGVSVPSEQWVEDNKDNFLALVTFEKDLGSSPMIMGFYPVKGAKSESYNVNERLLQVVISLIEQLQKGKINTQIGPQTFMPDTQQVFTNLKSELDEITKLIGAVKC